MDDPHLSQMTNGHKVLDAVHLLRIRIPPEEDDVSGRWEYYRRWRRPLPYEYLYPRNPQFHIIDTINWYDDVYMKSKLIKEI